MRVQLRKAWESRAPRERTTIAVVAMMLGAVLYLWLVLSGGAAHARLRTSVAALRAQSVHLVQQAAELERLRALAATSAIPASQTQTDLHELVKTQAGAAGLSGSLVKIDVPDSNQVVVVFGAVAYVDWINWVASLKSQQVLLDTCRIEAMSTPGMVSVTATLSRGR